MGARLVPVEAAGAAYCVCGAPATASLQLLCYSKFLSGIHSLANACLEGNVNAVRKLLEQGWSVHDSTDEGESLLSLACSAGKISC